MLKNNQEIRVNVYDENTDKASNLSRQWMTTFQIPSVWS